MTSQNLWLAVFIFYREDYSFTAYATISYLKIGPKANLLNNEAHVITMQVKKSTQTYFRVTDYFQIFKKYIKAYGCFSLISTLLGPVEHKR